MSAHFSSDGRDFTAEARGIVRGTYQSRPSRMHVLALAHEVADLKELLWKIFDSPGFHELSLELSLEIAAIVAGSKPFLVSKPAVKEYDPWEDATGNPENWECK